MIGMNVSIYTLVSPLHDPVATRRVAGEFLDAVRGHCGSCSLVDCGSDFSTFGTSDLDQVYVVTGGTEGLFLEVLPQIQGHVHILTSGKSNSLAARSSTSLPELASSESRDRVPMPLPKRGSADCREWQLQSGALMESGSI